MFLKIMILVLKFMPGTILIGITHLHRYTWVDRYVEKLYPILPQGLPQPNLTTKVDHKYFCTNILVENVCCKEIRSDVL